VRCENNALKVFSLNRMREEEAVFWEEDCFIYRGRFLRFLQDDSTSESRMSFTLGNPITVYERCE
jgi:hypothetical protein